MGKTRVASQTTPQVTLDTGALVALDKGSKRMIAMLEQGLKKQLFFYVPAGVVAQAWRNGRQQVNVARLLRLETTHVVALDARLARACGELCGATGTSDVVDASVVLVARSISGDLILTSDPGDLLTLDPKATVELI